MKSFKIASNAGADVLTHAPLASALDGSQARDIAQRGHAVSPTLVMMKKLVERFPAPIKPKKITYENVVQSVQALHRAGATILVGTDANSDPTAPNTIEHGASLHEELELLVQAGLSPIEALNGATQTAADVFGLTDRGRISPGQRADMLLVEGDPTTDILATQHIKQVWIAGEVVRFRTMTPKDVLRQAPSVPETVWLLCQSATSRRCGLWVIAMRCSTVRNGRLLRAIGPASDLGRYLRPSPRPTCHLGTLRPDAGALR